MMMIMMMMMVMTSLIMRMKMTMMSQVMMMLMIMIMMMWQVMRQVRALSHRLPVLESDRFRPEFFTQCNDVALITLLGTVMKSANNLNQFVNIFNTVYHKQGMGRRMRGIFF